MAQVTAEGMVQETDGALAAARAELAALRAVEGARGLENTLRSFHRIQLHLSNAGHRAGLFSEVHPEQAVRQAAEKATQALSAFATELSLDPGVYRALASLDARAFEPAARRFLEHTLRDFRRAGVDKDDTTRARLKELADRAVVLGQTFDRAIREDVRTVKLRPEQLRGLPADYRAAHPPGEDGLVAITTDYPDYLPFRQYAEDGPARRALYVENSSRAWPANDATLRELLAVRAEQARLLGYASWADYITEDKMSRTAATVAGFLERVATVSEQRARTDLAQILEAKRKDEPAAERVEDWEKAFYEERVKQERFAFDSQSVRPYFEFHRTRDGLLTLCGRLFDVAFRRVEGAPVWHPAVDVYDVERSGELLGRVYLDLHPRPDKYKHAAQFPLVSGLRGVQRPEGVLVCNFADPRVASPALLDHDDVVTLFHEFGHLMHHLLGGGQEWLGFSGVATEWDFVEAPSQMLEEWAWDPATLGLFARHVDTGEPLPQALVEQMRVANEFGKGTRTRHQLFYAQLSLAYHRGDSSDLDLTATMIDLQRRFSPFPHVPGTHFFASFGHLHGYSAMYYTYLWSLVIAKDLLSEFRRSGLLDATVARRYREAVLAPGGSRDAADLVAAFLGRPYGFEAFEAWLNRD
ncbi:MAG TPA: M3 family metallopeptidase [Myxococcaceae bacterium]|nr:M3 family metallopeptidase [Myxococcaceae bacterium]